ncbi:diguanylate cyclase with GAF sensor [Desulfuromonas soudanensis]|uniref:diguanylate cyclase n=1 Tax=Desulfuromonas soudanensis TaxID=1603606 RepID=A0A0M4D0Q7_9BACT|nr:diguanylate cyclase [Desulfuromonas soudanensis]ALC15514.1 diguanylate cyclase with GAF sensor [Desulfuromonas soudanensis]
MHEKFLPIRPLPPGELLSVLRDHAVLSRYSLALYNDAEILLARHGQTERFCGSAAESPFCTEPCQSVCRPKINWRGTRIRPRVYRCPGGLLYFVIPFKHEPAVDYILLGGGFREKFIDIGRLERLARERGVNGIDLLESWEELPSTSLEEMHRTAEEANLLLESLGNGQFHALSLERILTLFNGVAGIGPELDRVTSTEGVLALLSESLTILFSLSRIAVALPLPDGGVSIRDLLDHQAPTLHHDGKTGSILLRGAERRHFLLSGERAAQLLPGYEVKRLVCFPLNAGGRFSGCLLLADPRLSSSELVLVELLVSRAAIRLRLLLDDQEHGRDLFLTNRFMDRLGALTLARSRNELLGSVLNAATELLRARKGSLMLVDNAGQTLRIAASKGINRELAVNLRIPVGHGIAGGVAQRGEMLLVRDIEHDPRIAAANRPRFQSKSFISLPFKIGKRIIGVLNLSDWETTTPFTVTEEKLLGALLDHSGALIERAESIKRTKHLEALTITDPLTGLYNRRFLKERFEAEISRAIRKKESLAVMLIDLDHFKNYNDLCGHLAGDAVLRQTARILQRSAREMDLVIRFGGEEFCVLLPGASLSEALHVGERMRRAIETEPFPRQGSQPLGTLTASFGIAAYPENGLSAQSILGAADVALYQAKDQGRNCIVLSEPMVPREKISYL